MTLLRWLTFPVGSQTVILTVLPFWISFFLLMLLFVIQWLYLQLGNSDHVNVSVSIYFPSNSQQDALFHHIAFTILILNGTVFLIIWEVFHERMSLNSLLLLLLLYYVSRFRLELMYLPLIVIICSWLYSSGGSKNCQPELSYMLAELFNKCL